MANAGQTIAEGIDKYQRLQEQQALNDQVVHGLYQRDPMAFKKYIAKDNESPIEALHRYDSLGAKQKNALVYDVVTSRLADDKRQAQQSELGVQDAQRQQALAHANLFNTQADLVGSEPTPIRHPVTGEIIGLQPPKGQPHYFKQPKTGSGWESAYPVARGRLDKQGNFDNAYTGAEKGDIVQLLLPNGKVVLMPHKDYQSQLKGNAQPEEPQQQYGLAVGEIRKGYRYKGGDPSEPDSWEKVQ